MYREEARRAIRNQHIPPESTPTRMCSSAGVSVSHKMAVSGVAALFVALSLSCISVDGAVPLRARASCTDIATKKTYALGETWYTGPPRECMQLTCDGPDTISGLTCAPFQVPSWCSVRPGNPKAVYPDCCPTPVCPEENAIEGSSGGGTAAHGGPYGGYPYPGPVYPGPL